MKTIEIFHLSKTYKGKKGAKVAALQDLCLEIAPGEVFGFLGPNGAGKSTTIKIIMGQITPTSGRAKVCGLLATDPSARLGVGYLPENPAFYDFMTAREYLSFVGQAFNMRKDILEIELKKVLHLLELSDAADRPIRGYSKGMVQRLGIAQTLLHDPDVYVFDEPMSGLDPLGRALVKNIIKELKFRGKTVFFSTHITADVEVVCDRVGVIVKGRLLAIDTVKNILESGIEGYTIQFTRNDGTLDEVCVQKEALKTTLGKLAAEDVSVERIEPNRKDLESFFLEIVSKG